MVISSDLDSSPIRYHQLCITNDSLLCFRDDVYLCICADNQTRVECFLYEDQLDRCSSCLAGGRCLRGDHTRSSDFFCICPPCHSGGQCQFNTESFAFTLDQLFSVDLLSDQKQTTISLLIFFSVLTFLLAIPNNAFTFMTVRRRPCLRHGIGHYLLWMSVINQVNLAFFFFRLLHLIVSLSDTFSFSSRWNDVLCKSLNYFLSSSSRMVYWLTSLISIERVYTTLFVNGRWLKKPRVARRLIAMVWISVLLTDGYELLFYRSLLDLTDGRRSICVLDYSMVDRSVWMIWHLLFLTVHSLLPLLINLCSTITISIVVVKNRMNTRSSSTRKHPRRDRF